MSKTKLLVIIGTFMILLGLSMIMMQQIEKNRCDNLPLYKLVEDKGCQQLIKQGAWKE